MKTSLTRLSLPLAMIVVSLFSTDLHGEPPQGSGRVTFKVDGVAVTTDVWNFSRFTTSGDYNLTTNMHKDKRTILLNLSNPEAGAEISLGPAGSGSYGSYFAEFGTHTTNCTIESGTVKFTAFDLAAKTFSATFSFVARDAEGNAVNVTDGIVHDGKIGEDQILE